MKIIATFIIINILAINSYAFASSQNYFDEALSSYNEGKMDEATFLFEKALSLIQKIQIRTFILVI